MKSPAKSHSSSITKVKLSRPKAKSLPRSLSPSAPSPKSSLNEGKRSARSVIVSAASPQYVIQLYAARDRQSAEAFLAQQGVGLPLRIIQHDGWYKVVKGDYSHYSVAVRALQHLPIPLRQYHPWIFTDRDA